VVKSGLTITVDVVLVLNPIEGLQRYFAAPLADKVAELPIHKFLAELAVMGIFC
jgi:hypothetical protein